MTIPVDQRRIAFLDFVLAQEGKPYVINTDGPDTYDCNGLPAAGILKVAGVDLRATHSAHKFWLTLPATDEPKPGDLAFFGVPPSKDGKTEARITHVMVVVGDGSLIGACGGDFSVKTVEDARARNAKVMRKSKGIRYRPDFRGYRSLAKYLDPPAARAAFVVKA